MFDGLRYRITRIINIKILKKQAVMFNQDLRIFGKILVYNQGTIRIGSKVIIRSSFKESSIGGYPNTKIFCCKDANLYIDDKAGISNSVIYVSKSVFIGKYVNIGAGCLIEDSDHHSLDFYSRCLADKDEDIKSAPIIIKDGVFIGANSIILKGVTIGEKSIIGAGSVVTKDIPAGEVWGGNPARFIKKLDNRY